MTTLDAREMHLTDIACPDDAPESSFFSCESAARVRAFHKSIPTYNPTPLVKLQNLADLLGIKALYVKDESKRFCLNAFKALGASYAIGCALSEKLSLGTPDFARLTSPDVAEKVKEMTFITATDGNHGRGVAWISHKLDAHCIVYMPRGTAEERVRNIRALGAEVTVTDLAYDDAVRLTAQTARDNGYLLVQDTSWEGYEEIPRLIMQGYTTMGSEISEQLGGVTPTHLFLQAGVGSMAGALCAYAKSRWQDAKPTITIVEPNTADCIFQTAKARDGKLHAASGALDTMMAGLACGEPCPLAWTEIERAGDFALSIPEYSAATGMRVLSSPLAGDDRIISGESGVSSFGAVFELLSDPALVELKDALGLGPDSVVVCLSTEGATDRENWHRVVWGGRYPQR